MKYSRSFATLLGYDLAELEPSAATWISLIHPDDRKIAREAAGRHERGEAEQYLAEVRLRHKDGRWIWVSSRGKIVERDAERQAAAHVGDQHRRPRAQAGGGGAPGEREPLPHRGEPDAGRHLPARRAEPGRVLQPGLRGDDGVPGRHDDQRRAEGAPPPSRPGRVVGVWRESVEATLAPLGRALASGPAGGRRSGRDSPLPRSRIRRAPSWDRVGALVDVTEARKAAAYARSLIEASLDPMVTFGLDGKITDLNAATEAAIGLAARSNRRNRGRQLQRRPRKGPRRLPAGAGRRKRPGRRPAHPAT